MDYSEIYFAVASVSTIAVACVLILCLLYFMRILIDIRTLSKIARKEVEVISKGIEKGAGIFASNLSEETVSFAKTIFAILLSHFASNRSRTSSVRRNVKVNKQE